jgi:hypothetical protein
LFYLRHAQTVAGSGGTYNLVNQRIENVRTYGGETVTISFFARGTSASLTLPVIQLRQGFGAGGSADVYTTAASSVVIAGSTFAKYTYTVAVPSVTGKTIGTSSFLELSFALPINATFSFDIASVQLEPGTVATPFEQRPIGTELALCQRYFEKSYPINNSLGAVTGVGRWESVSFDGTNFYDFGRLKFTTRKRATPTMSLWSTDGTGGAFFNLSTSANEGNSRASNISDTGVHLDCSNAAMTTDNAFGTHWAASAEL